MAIERVEILVLNYDGRDLLRECLPSIVEAARRAPIPCEVAVVDNGSSDGSLALLADQWPGLTVYREPNRGLASFNAVLARIEAPAVLLLNNDVKLDPGAVGPLAGALAADPSSFFSAPLCWDFDGSTYEGMRTLVRSRFGLVQGMCRVPGHESRVKIPGETAAAGPVLMVDRRKFLALGGYDPLYFPGRIEDLDLGFAGWMAGWRGLYVPESVAYHRGFGSFGPAFGREGCDRLAARNTLLFAWKNLAGRRLRAHLAWLPARLAHSMTRGRGNFASAFREAVGRLGEVREARSARGVGVGDYVARQEAFFRAFAW